MGGRKLKKYKKLLFDIKLTAKLLLSNVKLLIFLALLTTTPFLRNFLRKEENYKPSSHFSSNAILICDPSSPCCRDSFEDSFQSLYKQTLAFQSITVIHSCDDAEAFSKESIQSVAKSQNWNNFQTDTEIVNGYCQEKEIEKCLLDKVQGLEEMTEESNRDGGVLILLSSHVMRSAAHEHSQLYLYNRPGIFGVRATGNINNEDNNIALSPRSLNFLPYYFITNNFGEITTEIATQYDIALNYQVYSSFIFLKILSNSRFVRTPLFYHKGDVSCNKFCLNEANLEVWKNAEKFKLYRAFLFSDENFYKWSTRKENYERFRSNSMEQEEQAGNEFSIDTRKMEDLLDDRRHIAETKTDIMFLVPFLEMGGSEQCILTLASYAKSKNMKVSIFLTMPEYDVDQYGELHLKHEWIEKARDITEDVFDLVEIERNDYFSKLLRYFLESRKPDYVFIANTQTIYDHLEYISLISPQSLIVDYSHMIHGGWEPLPGIGTGGLPKLSSHYSHFIHKHYTSSNHVAELMREWIDPEILSEDTEKVQTCYIGANVNDLQKDVDSLELKKQYRNELGIDDDRIVIMFAGRFVRVKGIDIMARLVKLSAMDSNLAKQLHFLFVGSGIFHDTIQRAKETASKYGLSVSLHEPVTDSASMNKFYQSSDILMLPSRNEGIALVLYEAMAAGLLVIATNVGGQSEIINSGNGFLIPAINSLDNPEKYIFDSLKDIIGSISEYDEIRKSASNLVQNEYTREKFQRCVFDSMIETRKKNSDIIHREESEEEVILSASEKLSDAISLQKQVGQSSIDVLRRPVEDTLTIGIKTYICDSTVTHTLKHNMRTIRENYPKVRVLLANDGPLEISHIDFVKDDPYTEEVRLESDMGISQGRNILVSLTKTEYFLLLDDDHVFDEDTELEKAIKALMYDDYDIVGLRIYNLPGIGELERNHTLIPRYVSKIVDLTDRKLRLCVWNENEGPSVIKIVHPIKVDVLHNAFIGKTSVLQENPWRNELKVNEHMTFFLDAKRANLKIGYLPSVFVHHRARSYTSCYKAVRFREEKFRDLLDYEDKFRWDRECGNGFPDIVQQQLDEENSRSRLRYDKE